MTRTFLIAALIITLPIQGFGKEPSKSPIDTATKSTAIAGGSGTTRFYGKEGPSSGRAEGSSKSTRFYGKDGSSDGRAER